MYVTKFSARERLGLDVFLATSVMAQISMVIKGIGGTHTLNIIIQFIVYAWLSNNAEPLAQNGLYVKKEPDVNALAFLFSKSYTVVIWTSWRLKQQQLDTDLFNSLHMLKQQKHQSTALLALCTGNTAHIPTKENPFICHIMNLLWSLSDKGTRVCFCWVPSHCGIGGNERVDQLAKETLDQDIDPLASVHYTDMKPLVNYIQKLVQTKWDVAVHGRDLYLVKPTLGPPKTFQHLTRAEEVVITRLRIGHTKATKFHILSRGPPTGCHHCGQTLTIDHMMLECALLQECRDEYYTVDSLNALFETIPETCIVEFLREAGFFYLIWCNLLISTSPQYWTIWSGLSNCLENESNSETHSRV